MILGRGSAQTCDELLAEYQTFVATYHPEFNPQVQANVLAGAATLFRRIQKPVATWTAADLTTAWAGREKATRYYYSAFVAFLLFRGYMPGTFALFTLLPGLARQHRQALKPHREHMEHTYADLGYFSRHVGSELNLIVMLLTFVGTSLTALTRADFERFRAAHQVWYSASGQHQLAADPRLTRVERYLVARGALEPAVRVFKHEAHFAQIESPHIRAAILHYMAWCDGKYQPSTIDSCRSAVLNFFLWFQAHYGTPQASIRDVTRPIALAYGRYLYEKQQDGTYSLKYRGDLYRRIRLFFLFVIEEGLAQTPDRNPFQLRDMPMESDPVPRYLPDRDIRLVLDYVNHEASLR